MAGHPGAYPARGWRATREGATNRLYKNNRDGTFTDVTEKAGLCPHGLGVRRNVGDYNNDGFEDLFITYWGQNVLYRNNGDGTFTDVTKAAGLLNPTARAGAPAALSLTTIATDSSICSSPTISISTSRAVPEPGQNSNCKWKGVPVNCGPRGLPTGQAFALSQQRRRHIHRRERAIRHRPGEASSYGMTAVAADFDNDGWPDIYVACDSDSQPAISATITTAHSREEGLERGVALNEDGMEQAGMGIGIGDFNLDGNLRYFQDAFHRRHERLVPQRRKSDISTTSPCGPAWGWRPDSSAGARGLSTWITTEIPISSWLQGAFTPKWREAVPAYPYKTPRVVFRNLGDGKFEELMDQAGPGVAAAHSQPRVRIRRFR